MPNHSFSLSQWESYNKLASCPIVFKHGLNFLHHPNPLPYEKALYLSAHPRIFHIFLYPYDDQVPS